MRSPRSHTARIGLVLLAGLAALTGACAPADPVVSAGDDRPNILVVVFDDAHYQSFGAAGHPALITPHLDALAERGIVFDQATAATPLCAPNRASLLTGLYSHAHGVRENPRWLSGEAARKNIPVPTPVDRLARAGYETFFVGKWHLLLSPADAGFERFLRGPARHDDDIAWEDGHLLPEAGPERLPEVITDHAIGLLENRDPNRPFFLWIAFHAPHLPLKPPPAYVARYDGVPDAALVPPGHSPLSGEPDRPRWRRFAATMTRLDENVGRVLDVLERSGALGNTAVFVTSDNGIRDESIHGPPGKIEAWEDSIRVPLLGVLPDSGGASLRAAGTTSSRPVSSVDLPATWLDLARIRSPDDPPPLHGRSLTPLYERPGATGERDPPWRDSAYVEYAFDRPGEDAPRAYRLVRTESHKLVVRADGTVSLYDLSADPNETVNRAAEASSEDVRLRLLARMREWIDSTNDAFPAEFDAFP